MGLKLAGWDVAVAVEGAPACVRTHGINFPDTLHHGGDLREVDLTAFAPVDLLAGGPPCQPFSVGGKKLGNDDQRDLVPAFVKAVRDVRPTFFLMENVANLARPNFRDYFEGQLADLAALGYAIHWRVLDAAAYGVPQHRLRLFVVGTPLGTAFAFPAPTHGPQGSQPYMTVRDALADCPEDAPNRAKVVYLKNPVVRRTHCAGLLLNGSGRPLNLDAPSPTILASAGGNRTHVLDLQDTLKAYHAQLKAGGPARTGEVANCRRLTLRESARLQSFPDSFTFFGSRSQQYRQIGNAVPPLLAKAVGLALLDTAKGLSVSKAPRLRAGTT